MNFSLSLTLSSSFSQLFPIKFNVYLNKSWWGFCELPWVVQLKFKSIFYYTVDHNFQSTKLHIIYNLIVDEWKKKMKKNKTIHGFFSAMHFHHKRSRKNELTHKQNMESIYLSIQLYGFWRAVIKFQVLFNAFLTIQFYTDLLLFWFFVVCFSFFSFFVRFLLLYAGSYIEQREKTRIWSGSRWTNTRKREWEKEMLIGSVFISDRNNWYSQVWSSAFVWTFKL